MPARSARSAAPAVIVAERSSAEWRQIIAGLEADHAKAEVALAAVEAERAPLPLPAATGDKAAAAALALIDTLRAELLRQRDTLAEAIRAGHARREAAEAAEEAAAAAARRAEAERIAEELVDASRAVDAALAQLRDALARREALVEALRLTRQLPGKLPLWLRARGSRMLGSLHKAGLHDFVPLDRVGPSLHVPVTDWTAHLLNGLRDAEGATGKAPPSFVIGPLLSPTEGAAQAARLDAVHRAEQRGEDEAERRQEARNRQAAATVQRVLNSIAPHAAGIAAEADEVSPEELEAEDRLAQRLFHQTGAGVP
jgi:hypothetical protein